MSEYGTLHVGELPGIIQSFGNWFSGKTRRDAEANLKLQQEHQQASTENTWAQADYQNALTQRLQSMAPAELEQLKAGVANLIANTNEIGPNAESGRALNEANRQHLGASTAGLRQQQEFADQDQPFRQEGLREGVLGQRVDRQAKQYQDYLARQMGPHTIEQAGNASALSGLNLNSAKKFYDATGYTPSDQDIRAQIASRIAGANIYPPSMKLGADGKPVPDYGEAQRGINHFIGEPASASSPVDPRKAAGGNTAFNALMSGRASKVTPTTYGSTPGGPTLPGQFPQQTTYTPEQLGQQLQQSTVPPQQPTQYPLPNKSVNDSKIRVGAQFAPPPVGNSDALLQMLLTGQGSPDLLKRLQEMEGR